MMMNLPDRSTLHAFSMVMTAGAGVGILMAAILTGHGEDQRKTLTSQIVLDSYKQNNSANKTVVIHTTEESNGIDPMVTAATRKNIPIRNIEDIISANPLDSDKKNQTLDEAHVKVNPGDTLFGIARRNKVSVRQLATLNALNAPFVIRPGQILRIR